MSHNQSRVTPRPHSPTAPRGLGRTPPLELLHPGPTFPQGRSSRGAAGTDPGPQFPQWPGRRRGRGGKARARRCHHAPPASPFLPSPPHPASPLPGNGGRPFLTPPPPPPPPPGAGQAGPSWLNGVREQRVPSRRPALRAPFSAGPDGLLGAAPAPRRRPPHSEAQPGTNAPCGRHAPRPAWERPAPQHHPLPRPRPLPRSPSGAGGPCLEPGQERRAFTLPGPQLPHL